MKKLLTIIPLVFLFCITFSCQQGAEVPKEPVADVEADIETIRNIVADCNAAVNTADIDMVMSHYADNAVVIPPNRPAEIGKEAIRSGIQELLDQFILQEEDVVENVKVIGDLAITHVTYSAIVTPKAGGEPIEPKVKGNWILVFKRQPDDAWKIIYSIWSNESLIYPIQAE
jgi:uncharacterized protein (TIGR02246 family)